jgi:hypothetical protein
MTAAQELRIALAALLSALQARETNPEVDVSSELAAARLVLDRSAPGAMPYLVPDSRVARFAGLRA